MAASASLTFPKERRLTSASEFLRVKREGSTHRGKHLMLGALAMNDAQSFRAGFITPRALGGAAVRNRVRRRLREIVRRHQHQVRDQFWIVTIAHREAARASYSTLEDEWLRLARRASILSA